MSILRLDGVHREVGTFVILDDITAAIAIDDRVGLVGPNGAGKTTLLRLAAGRDEPDEGVVHRKRGLTVGLLAQESHFDAAFMAAPDLRAAVRHGAAHLETMAVELHAMEQSGRVESPAYANLQHQFEILGGYTLDLRVDEALSGLGFTRDEWTKPPTALSGGEQTRATLARLVVAQPDLLFLDEPTNHLDIGAIEWLEEHLRRRHGALLVASHDRAFLDATVNRIWELRDRRLTIFRGDYTAYHRQREERDLRAVKDADTQTDQIEREKELVQRYRSHRKFSKMHEHEARLEKLQAERVVAPKATKKLRLPAGALAGSGPSRSGEIVIRIEGLVVGYLPGRGAVTPDGAPATEPKRVATVPFLAATRGDRIGIVGPNGAGKTTLLRTIAGDLPPLDGALSFGNAVQPGYLAQLRDAAIPGATVLDALLEAIPVTPGEARGFLARFLFRGDDVFKEVGKLSGGERSRLELALLGIMPSNLLLLDEPTNHLDIPAREAIESFMHDSPATLLVVSHDRRLLETVCTTLWVVDDGLAVPFDGGWKAWRAAVADGWTVHAAAEREAARLRGGAHGGSRLAAAGTNDTATTASATGRSGSTAVAEPPPAPGSASGLSARAGSPTRPTTRPGGAKPSAKLSKDAYRRQKTLVDGDLTRLGLRKSQLELSMGSPAIAANFVEMRRVASELADVEQALAAAENAWLDLEERRP
jgi:ATP-binding cassette subfamily F protein 3